MVAIGKSSAGVFDATAYGVKADGVTDDSAAVNAALLACFNAGGGIVKLPPGVILCNGAFQDTSNANSILWLPFNPRGAGGTPTVDGSSGSPNSLISISIEGTGAPGQSYNDQTEFTSPPPTTGTIIRTTKTGSGSNPALLSGGHTAYPVMNWMRVVLRNIGFRTTEGTGVTAVDLSGIEVCTVEHVAIDRDVNAPTLTFPSNTFEFGIKLPTINNGASTYVRNVWVDGYTTGINAGEHANLDCIVMQHCNTGLNLISGNGAVWVGSMLVQSTKYAIGATGTCHARIDLLRNERYTGGTWGGTYDVNDPSNLIHGSIATYLITGTGGPTFAQSGGTNLTVGASIA